MIINKLRIIAALKAAIEAKGCADFTINYARWDTRLNLSYGATRLHIKAAADAAGYDAVPRVALMELTHRTASSRHPAQN